MVNVQLFFAKEFGCAVRDHRAPVDLAALASAIINNAALDCLHLRFGASNLAFGPSKLTWEPTLGPAVAASMIFYFGTFAVNVMYAAPGQSRQGMLGAWTPKQGTTRICFRNL